MLQNVGPITANFSFSGLHTIEEGLDFPHGNTGRVCGPTRDGQESARDRRAVDAVDPAWKQLFAGRDRCRADFRSEKEEAKDS
jgi:hypothetical protein